MAVQIMTGLLVGAKQPTSAKDNVGFGYYYSDIGALISDQDGDYLSRNQIVWANDELREYKVRIPDEVYSDAVAELNSPFIMVNGATTDNVDVTSQIVESDVDDVELEDNKLFLLAGQNESYQNGIYYYKETDRSLYKVSGFSDFLNNVKPGIDVWVTEGDTLYNSRFRLQQTNSSATITFRKDDFQGDGKLSHTSDATIGDGLSLNAGMRFASDVVISDDLFVDRDADVNGSLTVGNNADIAGDMIAEGNAYSELIDLGGWGGSISRRMSMAQDTIFSRITGSIALIDPSDIPGDGCTFAWLFTINLSSGSETTLVWNSDKFKGLDGTTDTLKNGKHYMYTGMVYSSDLYGNFSEVGLSTV